MTLEVMKHHMNELNLDLQRFAGEGAAGDGSAGATAGEAPGAEAAEAVQEELLKEKPTTEAAPEPEEKETLPEPEPVTEGPEPGPERPEPGKEPEAEKAGTIEERLAALEEALARQNELYMQREQDLALRQHFSALEKQAETMRETFPGFDLRTELNDPVFVRLTSPMVGLSVEDAYFAVHHKELAPQMMAYGMQRAKNQMAQSIMANGARPREGGLNNQNAAADMQMNFRAMNRRERNAVYAAIHAGKQK